MLIHSTTLYPYINTNVFTQVNFLFYTRTDSLVKVMRLMKCIFNVGDIYYDVLIQCLHELNHNGSFSAMHPLRSSAEPKRNTILSV